MRLPTYQQLSKEQDSVMNLPLDGSYLVKGPPGTGKTVVALYRANTLQKVNKNPLLLMYNRLLMMYTSAATDELDIEAKVNTFHSWFWGYYHRQYGESPPQLKRYVFDWMEILTTVNSKPPAKDSLPYLIVDEAQDLPNDFFLLAQLLSQNLTLLADEHQRITNTQSTIAEILAQSGIPGENVRELRRNYRNTKEIAELAGEFYTGDEAGRPEIPTRSVDKPELLKHATRGATIDHIARYARINSTRQIGVIVKSKPTQRVFFKELAGRPGLHVQNYLGGLGSDAAVIDFARPGILVLTHKAAKGLEFDTVYLPELQELDATADQPDLKMMLYVLISRAREMLYLTYSGETRPKVLRHFDASLVEGM